MLRGLSRAAHVENGLKAVSPKVTSVQGVSFYSTRALAGTEYLLAQANVLGGLNILQPSILRSVVHSNH